MKKIISTRLHGILDYLSGFILILPWIVNFYEEGTDTWILAMVGMFTIIMSMLTNYEFGLVKLVPMRLHLAIDVLTALFLIALPFMYPMLHYYLYWPVLIGAVELLVVLFTSPRPFVVTKRDLNITLPSG
jgi:hypothetical protein